MKCSVIVGMKHHYILAGIFSFILLSSLLAVGNAARVTTALAMQNLKHADIAVAMKNENDSAVLGVSTGSADSGLIEVTAREETTALALLQENHIVVVEYTESGAIVRAVDGVGMSEEQRASDKNWTFAVNENNEETPSDRRVVRAGDKVVWKYL